MSYVHNAISTHSARHVNSSDVNIELFREEIDIILVGPEAGTITP